MGSRTDRCCCRELNEPPFARGSDRNSPAGRPAVHFIEKALLLAESAYAAN